MGAPRAVVMLPPFWQLKPPAGTDIYARAEGILAAGVGSSLRLVPARPFQVLPAFKGVLQSWDLSVLSPTAAIDITFTLLANGAPVPGFDNVQPEKVAANAYLFGLTGPVHFAEATTLTALVTNQAASGPWTVAASFVGWQWPRSVEFDTFGSG